MPTTVEALRDEFTRHLVVFGPERVAAMLALSWLANGRTYREALELDLIEARARVADLKTQLAAARAAQHEGSF